MPWIRSGCTAEAFKTSWANLSLLFIGRSKPTLVISKPEELESKTVLVLYVEQPDEVCWWTFLHFIFCFYANLHLWILTLKGRWGCLTSTSCLESRGCIWFHFTISSSSFFVASPVTLSWGKFSKNILLRVWLFCMALIEQLRNDRWEVVGAAYCHIYGTGICHYAFIFCFFVCFFFCLSCSFLFSFLFVFYLTFINLME